MSDYLTKLFKLEGKSAVVIGGGGYLCSEMARALARAGVSIAVLDLRDQNAEAVSLVGAVLWLASDAASFVTGAEVAIDGGFTCMSI